MHRRPFFGMKIMFQCLAMVIGLSAFLPMIRSDAWWIRGFEFPRIQMLTTGLILWIVLAFFGVESWQIDGGVWGFLTLSILLHAWWMRPYSKLARRQVLEGREEPAISVIISNVLMSNREAAPLLGLLRDKAPDLVIAVETDQWWVENLRELADDYPYAVEVPQDDTYGMVLRSRLPLIGASVKRLVKENIPSIHTQVRLAAGELVDLYVVHPKPPFPGEETSTTDRDAELLVIGKHLAKHSNPTIVAGDLNDVAWSETTRLFQKISRLLDPRIGRGFFNTYHAAHWWLRWPLDHVFLSDHFRLLRLELQPSIGSDHFPILVELSFEPHRHDQQGAPEKKPGDEREAREKISESSAVGATGSAS